jgi:hypothetical protein
VKYIKTYKKFDFLLEGRYDAISNKISSDIFNHWKVDFYEGKKSSRFFKFYKTDDVLIDVDANIEFIQDSNRMITDGGVYEEDDCLEIRFEIDPILLPRYFSKISMNLKDIVRHEIEHLTHHDLSSSFKKSKFIDGDQETRLKIYSGDLPRFDYFKLSKEVDANLQGMYFRSKKEKRPFRDVIIEYLDKEGVPDLDKESIMELWRKRLSHLNLPNF